MRPDVNLIRARLAAAVRHHPDDTDAITELRRDFRAERLADYITATVDDAPPLTTAQRDRLSALLQAGGSDG